jgi:hypothetical protein
MIKTTRLAVRVDDANRNHHLWDNNGSWWCHFTVHWPDDTAERVRVSLKTSNVDQARLRRDRLFARIKSNLQAA